MKRKRAAALGLLLMMLTVTLRGAPALAAATSDEVFRSINAADSKPIDYSKLIPWGCGALGLLIVGIVMNSRSQKKPRTAAPAASKNLNNPAKLLREISRAMAIKPAAVKQLKLLAEEQGVSSPLTLLICPSALEKARQRKGRAQINLPASPKLR